MFLEREEAVKWPQSEQRRAFSRIQDSAESFSKFLVHFSLHCVFAQPKQCKSPNPSALLLYYPAICSSFFATFLPPLGTICNKGGRKKAGSYFESPIFRLRGTRLREYINCLLKRQSVEESSFASTLCFHVSLCDFGTQR